MQKIIGKFVKRSTDINFFPWNHNSYLLCEGKELAMKQHENHVFSWLHSAAPSFQINGSNVRVLHEPSEFYKTIVKKCASAQHRIALSSLYLGTGDLEKNLINTIKSRMEALQGKLNVTLLFDYTRGSRGRENTLTMVGELLQENPQNCHVSLYHTVELRGFMKAIMPPRYNEIIGIQHMKLYLIDDTLIISGANLSNDYFTNRQDRYFVVEDCKTLVDFYSSLISCVCEFSLKLQPDGETTIHPNWPADCHPFLGDKDKFVKEAQNRINEIFNPYNQQPHRELEQGADTWIFPLIQMGQLGIRHDTEITLRILEKAPKDSHIHFATGYFNITNDLMRAVLTNSQASYSLLSAHPLANGFLNAKGPAGGIPAAYTKLTKVFFERIRNMNQDHRVKMYEFIKPGWTYHAKGLWITLPGKNLPSVTLIGSPNFGSRSADRDLETQIAIVTSNDSLQRQLGEERDRLYKRGALVDEDTFLEPDRKVPMWVHVVSRVFRNYF